MIVGDTTRNVVDNIVENSSSGVKISCLMWIRPSLKNSSIENI